MSFMKFMVSVTPFYLMAVPACWRKGNDGCNHVDFCLSNPSILGGGCTALLVLPMVGGCKPPWKQPPAFPRETSEQSLWRGIPSSVLKLWWNEWMGSRRRWESADIKLHWRLFCPCRGNSSSKLLLCAGPAVIN